MSEAVVNAKQLLVFYTDDVLLAAGAKSLLEELGQFEVITTEPETSELVPFVAAVRPHFILVDTAPDMTIGLFAAIREASSESKLVLWGRSFSEEMMDQCKELGVSAFLLRGCSKEKFQQSVMKIAAGEAIIESRPTPARATKIELTPRESQLVSLLAQGIRNKEIANCLGITEGTVRIYLSKLFIKVGARDRFELAVFGLKNA